MRTTNDDAWSARLLEGELTFERVRDVLASDTAFALAPSMREADGERRLELRPAFVRARALSFATVEERNLAVRMFGPGVLAKSHVGSRSTVETQPFSIALNGADRSVDQIVPTFVPRDAISNEALLLRDALRAAGFRSSISSPLIAPSEVSNAEPYVSRRLRTSHLVICHFAIGSLVTAHAASLPVRRTLWYHNVTPASYFRPYDPVLADLLDAGRAQLARLAGRFDTLIADSAFNARELDALTDRPVDVVPFPVDFRRFDTMPDEVAAKTRERVRWLTVGRIAPNKGLMRLVAAFAAFAAHCDAELILVGGYRAADPFYLRLRFEIARRGLTGSIRFAGSVTDSELLGWYESADLYVTLSEHEGFCAPLIEAMYCDIPIVASTSGAIPETLGEAGLMVEDAATPADIAALAGVVLADDRVRTALLVAQRKRRADFAPDRTAHEATTAIEHALGARRPRIAAGIVR